MYYLKQKFLLCRHNPIVFVPNLIDRDVLKTVFEDASNVLVLDRAYLDIVISKTSNENIVVFKDASKMLLKCKIIFTL